MGAEQSLQQPNVNYNEQLPRLWQVRGRRKYRFGRVLGAGAAGVAVLAADVTDESEHREVVIKLQEPDTEFRAELSILQWVQENAQRVRKETGTTLLPLIEFFDGFTVSVRDNPFNSANWPTDDANIQRFGARIDASATNRVGITIISFSDSGNIDTFLRDRPVSLDARPRAFLTLSLALGLAFLHAIGVHHRDIAGPNIVVSSLPFAMDRSLSSPTFRYNVRLANNNNNALNVRLTLPTEELAQYFLPRYIDFDRSVRVNDSRTSTRTNQAITQIFNRAPEIFYSVNRQGVAVFEERSDVWSLGMVLLDIGFQGRVLDLRLFVPDQLREEYTPQFQSFCQLQQQEEDEGRATPAITDFICLDDPDNLVTYFFIVVTLLGPPPTPIRRRLRQLFQSFDALLVAITEHVGIANIGWPLENEELNRAYGTQGTALIKQMIDWDPEKRPRAAELLRHPYFQFWFDSELRVGTDQELRDADGDVNQDEDPFDFINTRLSTDSSARLQPNPYTKTQTPQIPPRIVWQTEQLCKRDARELACEQCGERRAVGRQWLRCTRCRVAHYCSRKCQRKEWAQASTEHYAHCSE